MATSRRADEFFGPLVATTYSLPKSSLVPLFILWFGIGDVTNILSVVLACLLPVIVSTYHGVQGGAARDGLERAGDGNAAHLRCSGESCCRARCYRILTGVRIALGFCFVLTISAEMIAAKTGIGKLIFLYGESGAYAHMFGGLLAVVIVAYAADRALLAGDEAFPALARFHSCGACRWLTDTASPVRRACGLVATGLRRSYPLLLVLAAWELVGARRADPAVVPADLHRGRSSNSGRLLVEGEIVVPLLVSLYRAFAGLALAVVLGVAAGLLMARSRCAHWALDPLVSIAFPAPKIAFVPIFILWFGIDHLSKILLVAFTCVFPMIVATYHGAVAVSRTVIWSAQAMGTPERKLLLRVILPGDPALHLQRRAGDHAGRA